MSLTKQRTTNVSGHEKETDSRAMTPIWPSHPIQDKMSNHIHSYARRPSLALLNSPALEMKPSYYNDPQQQCQIISRLYGLTILIPDDPKSRYLNR